MTDPDMQRCILAAYETGVGSVEAAAVACDDLAPSLVWDFPYWAMFLGTEHVGYCRDRNTGRATLAALAAEVA